MKRFNFVLALILMVVSVTLFSCGKDDVEDWLSNERICITNETSYDWHNATVRFEDEQGKVSKSVGIGAVKKDDYVYVNKQADYFVVTFTDDKGARHESERYYSNPYVDVSFLTK